MPSARRARSCTTPRRQLSISLRRAIANSHAMRDVDRALAPAMRQSRGEGLGG
jgi:hypothetical protein